MLARAATVLISGTGRWADGINGYFAAAQQKGLDGRVVYDKCGDANMCIKQIGGIWLIKALSDKGKAACYAFVQAAARWRRARFAYSGWMMDGLGLIKRA